MWQPSKIDVSVPLPAAAANSRNRPSQRLLDLTLALPALIITAPVIAAAAVLTAVTSKGGPWYRARRVGVDGEIFEMYKIRTMVVEQKATDGPITMRNDPRVTRIGKVLRALKIDELPQLVNVVVGQMSLIGPRPEDFEIVSDYYTDEMKTSLRVRPGMTSAASVFWYPDLMAHDPPPPGVEDQQWYLERHMLMELRLDVHYELERTLLSDLLLIASTPITILVASIGFPKKRVVPRNSMSSH